MFACFTAETYFDWNWFDLRHVRYFRFIVDALVIATALPLILNRFGLDHVVKLQRLFDSCRIFHCNRKGCVLMLVALLSIGQIIKGACVRIKVPQRKFKNILKWSPLVPGHFGQHCPGRGRGLTIPGQVSSSQVICSHFISPRGWHTHTSNKYKLPYSTYLA